MWGVLKNAAALATESTQNLAGRVNELTTQGLATANQLLEKLDGMQDDDENENDVSDSGEGGEEVEEQNIDGQIFFVNKSVGKKKQTVISSASLNDLTEDVVDQQSANNSNTNSPKSSSTGSTPFSQLENNESIVSHPSSEKAVSDGEKNNSLEIAELKSTIKQLEKEKKLIQNKAKSFERKLTILTERQATNTANYDIDLNTLNQQVIEFKLELEKQKAMNKQLDSLNKKLDQENKAFQLEQAEFHKKISNFSALEIEFQELSDELAAAKQSILDLTNQEENVLKSDIYEMERLKASLIAFEEEKETFVVEIETLKSTLASVEAMNSSLATELSAAKNEKVALSSLKSSLESEKSTLLAEVKKLKAQSNVLLLRENLNEIKQSKDAIKFEVASTLSNFQNEMATMVLAIGQQAAQQSKQQQEQSVKQSVEKTTDADVSSLEAQVASLQDTITNLELQLDEATTNNHTLSSNVASLTEKLAASHIVHEQLTNIIELLKTKINTQKSDFEAHKVELSNQISTFTSEKESLLMQIVTLEEREEKLRAELVSQQDTQRIVAEESQEREEMWKNELSTTHQLLSAAKEAIGLHENNSTAAESNQQVELAKLQQEITSLVKANYQLEQHNSTFSSENSVLTEQNSTLSEKIAQLQADYAQLEAEMEASEKDTADFNANRVDAITAVQKDHEHLLTQVEQLQEQLNCAVSAKDTLQLEVEELRRAAATVSSVEISAAAELAEPLTPISASNSNNSGDSSPVVNNKNSKLPTKKNRKQSNSNNSSIDSSNSGNNNNANNSSEITQKIEQYTAEIAQLQSEISTLTDKLSTAESQLLEQSTQIEQFISEISVLSEKLDSVQSLQTEFNTLTNNSEQTISTMQEQNNYIATLTADNDALTSQVNALQTTLNEAVSAKDTLQVELHQLKIDHENSIIEFETKHSALEREYNTIYNNKTVTDLQAINTELTTKLNNEVNSNKELSTLYEALQIELANTVSSKDTLQVEVDRLVADLNVAQSATETVLAQEKVELHQATTDLQYALSAKDTLQVEVDGLNEKLSELQSQLQSVQAENAESITAHQSTAALLTHNIAERSTELAELKEEYSALSNENAELLAKCESLSAVEENAVSLQDTLNILNESVASLTAQNNTLQTQLNTTLDSKNSLLVELQSASETVTQLQSELVVLQQNSTNNSELTAKIQELTNSNGALLQTISENERVIAEFNEKMASFTLNITQLTAEKSDLASDKATLSEEVAFLSEKSTSLEVENTQYKQAQNDANLQITKLQGSLLVIRDEYSSQISILESQLQERVVQNATLHEQLRTTVQNMKENELQLEVAKSEVNTLRSESSVASAQAAAHYSDLQRQFEVVSEELTFVQSQHNTAQNSVAQQLTAIHSLTAQVEQLTQIETLYNESAHHTASLEERVTQAEESLAQLNNKKKKDLDSLKKQNTLISQLQHEKVSFAETISELQHALHTLQFAHENLIETSSSEICALTQKCAAYETQVAALIATVAAATQLEVSPTDVMDANSRHSDSSYTLVDNTNRELAGVREELHGAQSKIAVLLSEKETLSGQSLAAQEETATVNALLLESRQATQELTNRLQSAGNEAQLVADLQVENRDLETKLEIRNQEIVLLQDQVIAKTNEAIEMENRINALNQEISLAKEEYAHRLQQLKNNVTAGNVNNNNGGENNESVAAAATIGQLVTKIKSLETERDGLQTENKNLKQSLSDNIHFTSPGQRQRMDRVNSTTTIVENNNANNSMNSIGSVGSVVDIESGGVGFQSGDNKVDCDGTLCITTSTSSEKKEVVGWSHPWFYTIWGVIRSKAPWAIPYIGDRPPRVTTTGFVLTLYIVILQLLLWHYAAKRCDTVVL